MGVCVRKWCAKPDTLNCPTLTFCCQDVPTTYRGWNMALRLDCGLVCGGMLAKRIITGRFITRCRGRKNLTLECEVNWNGKVESHFGHYYANGDVCSCSCSCPCVLLTGAHKLDFPQCGYMVLESMLIERFGFRLTHVYIHSCDCVSSNQLRYPAFTYLRLP